LGKAGGINRVPETLEGVFEKFGLRMFTATVDTFNGDQ